jgi:flagellar hook-basal body complex protein FliE
MPFKIKNLKKLNQFSSAIKALNESQKVTLTTNTSFLMNPPNITPKITAQNVEASVCCKSKRLAT